MKKKLLVIYYHEVVEQGQGYSYQKIEKRKFEEQMRYLRDHGYHTLYFSELGENLPDKAVVVSFDDGFRSVYEHAAPIMERYGVRGNIYLPTAYIDQDAHFMTWDMVRDLRDRELFEMQAHTHRHVDIRTLDDAAMRGEIETSDQIFNDALGYLPVAFCMPFGTYDAASIKRLKGLGRYKYILGSYYGNVSAGRLCGAVLPRIGISNDDSIETFAHKLEGRLNWKGPLQRVRLLLHNLKKERVTTYEY